MSILSAIRQQSSSIDDLAKLPQAMIMQMAQRKQIAPEMVAPILSRKAEMIDAAAKVKAMQGGVPRTSVMEQLMAQNATAEAPESSEMGVAQLPVPERQYAGGGIIAFAKGSLIGEDDDEIDPYEDYAKAAAAMQRANAMPIIARQPSKLESGLSQILPKSYEAALAEKGETPASIRKAPAEVAKTVERPRGSHKYEDMVVKEAERLGVDPKLALHVLYKETGNLKNPETAKSPAGAIGVMQLMPKTAKGLGVDPLNPEENIRGGVTYLKQMYDKYQDPTLALAAYNAGPGRLDKVLKSGQGIAALPRETQNYIRMAGGGEVQHFEEGGAPRVGRASQAAGSSFFPESQRTTAAKKKKDMSITSSEIDRLNEIARGQGVFPEGSPALPGNEYPLIPPATLKTENNNLPPPPAPVEKTVEPKSAFEMFLEQNAADRTALSKQREEDRNMALLAAGLGMLGGESPYAFTNIGKGGLSGVSYLSEANKQRAAEKAALDKSRVAAMHYQNLGDYYKSGITSKEERLQLEKEKMLGRQLGEKEKLAQNRAIAALKVDLTAPLDPQTKMKIDNYIAQDLAKDKGYMKMYEQMYGFPYELGVSSAPALTSGYKLVK